jgi:hypothetical protein
MAWNNTNKQEENDLSVWSTDRVKEWYDKYTSGAQMTDSPWLNNMIGVRRPNIVFNFTKSELEEFTKCASDVTYFAKYCEILHGTEGYKPVVLREYQKNLLSDYQKYRFNIVMSCRQAGKCLFNGKITVNQLDKNKDFVIEDLYYSLIPKTLLTRIKLFLLRFSRKNILKNTVLSLIEMIEKYEYRNLSLDENDISKKIIDTVDISHKGLKVLSHDGYHPITSIHKTQPYSIYVLDLESGERLECADNHIVFCKGGIQKFVKNLTTEDYVMTKSGLSKVASVRKTGHRISMYDITVDSEEHSFYSNNILSHNTVSSCIFLLHQAFFNTDRNIGVAANKARTATEILDKIKQILFRMPFFLMPGVRYMSNESITFENGCKIICQATTKRSFIGYTIHTLYLDEFAHVEPHLLDQFYENIVPTVSSMDDSRVIVTSTQNGFNKYYNMWQDALDGRNNFHPIRIDYWDIPGHDKKWKEEQIKLLGSEEEFMRQFGNVFSLSGSILLSAETLEHFNKNIKEYVYKDISALENNYKEDWQHLVWRNDFDIENLADPNRRFVISCDLAEGGGRNADYIIFQFLEMKLKENFDKETDKKNLFKFEQVGIFRSNTTSLDTAAELLYRIAVQVIGVDNVRLIIESNTYGSLFMTALLKVDGENNDFTKDCICRFIKNQMQDTKSYGLYLNNQNKKAFCIRFRGMCSNGQYDISEKNTIMESECFSRVGDTYKANGSAGSHDDTIMALVDSSAFIDTTDFVQFMDELLEINGKFDDYEANLDTVSDSDSGFSGSIQVGQGRRYSGMMTENIFGNSW